MHLEGFLLFVCLVVIPTLKAAVIGQNNVVEVYFIVDRKAINRYEGLSTASTAAARLTDAHNKINEDIDYMITEVNTLLNSLSTFGEYSVNVQIAKRKLVLLDNNVFSGNILQDDTLVPATEGLEEFDAYLAAEGAHNTLNYDLALLWTGYDIYSDKTTTTGFAYIGTVCQAEKATSIVEFDGTYHTVVVTAHEIAHNLGASHDSASSGYVMAPSAESDAANRWKFSLCSASDVSGVINQLSPNCLLTTNAASVIPNTGVTDDMMNPDTICKRAQQNENSYMCKNSYFYDNQVPSGDAVCSTIYCLKSGNTCSTRFSSDGLICGTGKSCKQGACVADSRPEAAAVDESCIWGDQAMVNFFNGPETCDSVLSRDLRYCGQSSIYTSCCGTCKDRNTGIPGCEWGDGNAVCSSYTPTPSFCAANDQVCCQTCHGVTRKRSTDTTNEVVLESNPPMVVNDHNRKEPPQTQPDSHSPQV